MNNECKKSWVGKIKHNHLFIIFSSLFLCKARRTWRSFKEHQAVQRWRGARGKWAWGSRLWAHGAGAGAQALSLAILINLPASTESLAWPIYQPCSREGAPFFHYWYRCITRPLPTSSNTTEEPQRSENPMQTVWQTCDKWETLYFPMME